MIYDLISLILIILLLILFSFIILLPHINIKKNKIIGILFLGIFTVVCYALIFIHLYRSTESIKELIIVLLIGIAYFFILFIIDKIRRRKNVSEYLIFPLVVSISLIIIPFIGSYFLNYRYYHVITSIIFAEAFYLISTKGKEISKSKVIFIIYCFVVFFIIRGVFQSFAGDLDKISKQTNITKDYLIQEMNISKDNITNIIDRGSNREKDIRILAEVIEDGERVLYEFKYFKGNLELEGANKF